MLRSPGNLRNSPVGNRKAARSENSRTAFLEFVAATSGGAKGASTVPILANCFSILRIEVETVSMQSSRSLDMGHVS